MHEITFHAMGSQMMVAVDSQQPSIKKLLDEVPDWFEAWEQRLSRFRPDSELNLLNRNSGTQPISPLMAEVVREAQIAMRQSGGLVNPLVLDALETAGYDQSFEDLSKNGESADQNPEPAAARPSQEDGLRLDFTHRQLTLPKHKRLDLGGIGKGWAADRASHRLGRLAPTLVDAGGDISVSSPRTDGSPWPIGVADPLNSGEQLDVLLLRRGGVATSGRDFRRWKKNGAWQHHIIDPRTGLPAYTDVLSATVVASSTRMAETAAKTALILGSLDGLLWLKEHNLAGLLALEDGTILFSSQWMNYIWRENE